MLELLIPTTTTTTTTTSAATTTALLIIAMPSATVSPSAPTAAMATLPTLAALTTLIAVSAAALALPVLLLSVAALLLAAAALLLLRAIVTATLRAVLRRVGLATVLRRCRSRFSCLLDRRRSWSTRCAWLRFGCGFSAVTVAVRICFAACCRRFGVGWFLARATATAGRASGFGHVVCEERILRSAFGAALVF